MKFSIITAVYNREHTIGEAMRCLQAQSYGQFEHVLIDGASSDGTLSVIRSLADERSVVISEPDSGIYDAINKGISASTGDVIGLLHSDDYFPSPNVLAKVAEKFTHERCDIVYGDLEYVSNDVERRTIRLWKAGEFNARLLKWGWMPPHPTVFVKRSIIDKHGVYDTSYKIAADYDIILRYFGDVSLIFGYVPEVITKMRMGGASNRSISNIITKIREDYNSINRHNIGGILTLMAKSLSKIKQFL